MSKSTGKGKTGTSCITGHIRGIGKNKLWAELELRRLRKKPGKMISRGATLLVAQHIEDGTADIEYNYVLIDYRNNNERIKTKMMTRYDAAVKNNLLKGSGFAWALVQA